MEKKYNKKRQQQYYGQQYMQKTENKHKGGCASYCYYTALKLDERKNKNKMEDAFLPSKTVRRKIIIKVQLSTNVWMDR